MQPLFPQYDGKTDTQFWKLLWNYNTKPNHGLTAKEIVQFKQTLFESFATDEDRMHQYEALIVAIYSADSQYDDGDKKSFRESLIRTFNKLANPKKELTVTIPNSKLLVNLFLKLYTRTFP